MPSNEERKLAAEIARLMHEELLRMAFWRTKAQAWKAAKHTKNLNLQAPMNFSSG